MLASIAEVLAAWDPGRADRLIDDAEGLAQSITDQASRATALTSIAETLAASDPGRADRLIADAEDAALPINDQACPWP